jgi:serine/threonine protein kinase
MRYHGGALTVVLAGSQACPQCGTRYPRESTFCAIDGQRLVASDEAPDASAAAVVMGGATSDPYVGSIVNGDIELRALAGVGAMGRVYRGHQRGTDRDVAVKILNRELWGREDLVHRFNREARIASKLKHPHIVEVYLTGQLPNGALYIVMEFLEGLTLSQELHQHGGSLPFESTLAITVQICDALAEAHKQGIVHRDVKPENVMLVQRGSAPIWTKVLDFGIAKAATEDAAMQTAAGVVFGTARYISPEAAQGRPVGPQGDVYSIAVMLYEMLSGRVPFEGQGVALMVRHVQEAPPMLAFTPQGAAIPAPIVALVMQNLAKAPHERAPNAGAFGDALLQVFQACNVAPPEMGRLSHPLAARLRTLAPTENGTPLPDLGRAQAQGSSQFASSDASDALQPSTKSRGVWPYFLTFVVGASIAGALVYRFDGSKMDERQAYIARVQAALTEGHYVSPPGEKVQELTVQGLERWPNDGELRKLRSNAESEMITMAMAARTSGDLLGARNLARDAYSLDPTDNTARLMKQQCEEEVRFVTSGATPTVPRLMLEAPSIAKAGDKLEMTAKLYTQPKAKISGVRATLLPNGKTAGGVLTTVTQIDAATVRITLQAPQTVGSYDLTFEANVDGVVVLAMRDLDVTPR